MALPESPEPYRDPPLPDVGAWWRRLRNSVTFKLFAMLGLLLVSLIPVAFVQELVHERQSLQRSVGEDVSQKWAGQQIIRGPVLSVPYNKVVLNDKKQAVTTRAYLHILPEKLEVNGSLAPETLHRGIYDMVVYRSDLALKGHFVPQQFQNLPVADNDLLWNQAFVSLGIPDLRGIEEAVKLNWQGQSKTFDPGTVTEQLYNSGIHVPVKLDTALRKQTIRFDLKLDLKGNQQLYVTPVGKETIVKLSAPWSDPSFDGAFLPAQRQITPNDFSAEWKVLHLNRNFPQVWQDSQYNFEGSAFGVHLIQTVDHYLKVLRSVKYAIFFIGLTFLIFFFVEMLARRTVHPLQYLLVGFALCVFYTLLLSISEHLGFDKAYLISAVMTVGLITSYAAGFLGSKRLTALTGGVLVVLYSFIYVIIYQEAYALLGGSLGLFIVLALVMFFSRRLDFGNQTETNAH